MLTREQNDLLTQTGPGTPAGALMRRYWQPAALSEELPPGGPPLPVRLLGEDLVLFRDEKGTPGLLGLHCSHRGADLSYGRLEDGGLRCIYHGWLYDVHGRCLQQPGEPAGSTFHERIRHPAYPCQEVAGLIFAYLGPGEPPLLPGYRPLTAPEAHRFIPSKHLNECNYLQGNEGNIDPAHSPFLHRLWTRREDGSIDGASLTVHDLAPTIHAEETDYGVRVSTARRLGPDRIFLKISNFVMPNGCAIGGGPAGDGYQMDWHVPIDDTHHWKYTVAFQRSGPLPDRNMTQYRASLTDGYRRIRTAADRYLQDREEMLTSSFTGMGATFQDHDGFAVESPGPIQDRAVENLGSTDKAIVMARLMLLNAIRDMQEGRDPPHVIREPDAVDLPHLVVASAVLPSSADWRNYALEPAAAQQLVSVR